MTDIAEIGRVVAVGVADRGGGLAEVARAEAGIFERRGVGGEDTLADGLVARGERGGPVAEFIAVEIRVRDLCAVIEAEEVAFVPDFQDAGGGGGVELEDFFVLEEGDGHVRTPFGAGPAWILSSGTLADLIMP